MARGRLFKDTTTTTTTTTSTMQLLTRLGQTSLPRKKRFSNIVVVSGDRGPTFDAINSAKAANRRRGGENKVDDAGRGRETRANNNNNNNNNGLVEQKIDRAHFPYAVAVENPLEREESRKVARWA